MNHSQLSVDEGGNINKAEEPEVSCEPGPEVPSTSKRLRKRRLDLNSCFSVSNFICSESYCGITLPDQESLEHHYSQHAQQELEKLKNIRIKKKNEKSDVEELRNARKDALEAIKERRDDRSRRRVAANNVGVSSDESFTECPLCQKQIIDGFGENLRDHFATCVKSKHDENTEEFIDVDEEDYEEYEWAGQKRIRSTSLFKGGLKAAGFLTIKKTREDEVLDVTGEDEEIGTSQFDETDLLRIEDEVLDSSKEASICNVANTSTSTSQHEISEFNSNSNNYQTMCKICMCPYTTPLTSTTCWHVHCERCWMLALGSKKLCPQCKSIVTPGDLRKIYL